MEDGRETEIVGEFVGRKGVSGHVVGVSSYTTRRKINQTNRFAMNHKMLNYTNINRITPPTPRRRDLGNKYPKDLLGYKSSWSMSLRFGIDFISKDIGFLSWTNLVGCCRWFCVSVIMLTSLTVTLSVDC